MRVLEMAVLYAKYAPYSAKMLQKITNDYKRKMDVLEKIHKEASAAWKVELAKARTDLGISAKALAEKEASLRGMGLKHAFLIRTLYGLTLCSAVREVALKRSMAPVEDEIDGERALQAWVDLVNNIRVLGDDFLATAQDTYDSTISQQKLNNLGVELVTEGTGPLHWVEDGRIVSPDVGDRRGAEESAD